MANSRGKREKTNPVDEAANMSEEMIEKSLTKEEEKLLSKNGIVICSYLNVRAHPVSGSTVLQTIPKYTKVEILDDSNDVWYKVRVGEIECGFCLKEFITITK